MYSHLFYPFLTCLACWIPSIYHTFIIVSEAIKNKVSIWQTCPLFIHDIDWMGFILTLKIISFILRHHQLEVKVKKFILMQLHYWNMQWRFLNFWNFKLHTLFLWLDLTLCNFQSFYDPMTLIFIWYAPHPLSILYIHFYLVNITFILRFILKLKRWNELLGRLTGVGMERRTWLGHKKYIKALIVLRDVNNHISHL